MSTKRSTVVRNAANLALGLGLMAVLLFSTVSPAYAANVTIVSVGVGGPSAIVTYGSGGPVSYTVSVLCGGQGNAAYFPLSISGSLPPGVNASFSPTQLYFPNGCGTTPSKTSTLTLSVSATTPAYPSYTFSVAVGGQTGSGQLTVSPLMLTIIGFSAQNKQYDGNTIAVPDVSGAALSSGVLQSDAPNVHLDSSHVGASFSDKWVGGYKLVQASGFALTGSAAPNYNLVQPTAHADITPADLLISFTPAPSKPYDGNRDAAVTFLYTPLPGDANSISVTGVGTYDTKHVGSHKLVTVSVSNITLSGAAATSYKPVISTTPVYADIIARSITVSAFGDSKQYDGTTNSSLQPWISSGTLAPGDANAFTQAFDSAAIGVRSLIVGGAVNDGNSGNNYAVAYVPASGLITARPITVTADAKSKVYGAADPGLTYQVTTGSLLGGDAFSGSLSRQAGEDVGSHGITQGTLSINSNYALTFAGANLSISARSIEVTADSQSKVYGAADPGLTYKITTGSLAFSDAFTGFLSRDPGESVGSYPINKGTLSLGSNYNLSFVPSSLAISARSLTVTADAQSKVYGAADPEFTYQVTTGSLAFSDAFTGSLARTAGEDVGSYPINKGNLALSSNYSLSFNGASLSISARAITTVAADDINSNDIQPIPALTFQYTPSGVVISNPPTCVVRVSDNPLVEESEGDAALPAGQYNIVCSGGSDPNYSFAGTNYVNGTLTVALTNQPPTEIYLNSLKSTDAPISVYEFQPADTLIGTFTDADPDFNDIANFSFVDGNGSCDGSDNSLFQLAGTGSHELRIPESPAYSLIDFETKPVLHICVSVADGKGYPIAEPRSFTFNIQNVLGGTSVLSSVAASDGYVLESPTNHDHGGKANASGSLFVGDDKSNMQYRSILSFNTTLLPHDQNLVLTKVTLQLRVQSVVGNPENLGNLLMDLKQANFGTKPSLEAGDWQAAPDAGGSAIATLSDITPPTGTPKAGDFYTADINPALLNAHKTATGITQFRLRFDTKTANALKADSIAFYSGNTSITGNRPQLFIEYSLPTAQYSLPSVGAQDGQIIESAAGNNAGGAVSAGAATLAVGDAKTGQTYRSILSFNTALLPDNAIITRIQLQLKLKSKVNDPFGQLGSLVVDLKQQNFGDKLTLEPKDFQSSPDQAAMATIPNPGSSSVVLLDLDPSLFSIDTAKEISQLRLRFTGSGLPNNNLADTLLFYSGNNIANLRPQLIVTFSIP